MELHIIAKPNSKIDAIEKTPEGDIKVRIKAPPVDGKANEYLVRFLAKKLGLPKSKVVLVKGHTNPHKKFEIEMEEAEVKKLLGL